MDDVVKTPNSMQTVTRHWRRWMPRRRIASPRATAIAAELFGLEQLVRHASDLARHHSRLPASSHSLLARLDQNEQILRAYNSETRAVEQTRRVTHAAEWLLDTFS